MTSTRPAESFVSPANTAPLGPYRLAVLCSCGLIAPVSLFSALFALADREAVDAAVFVVLTGLMVAIVWPQRHRRFGTEMQHPVHALAAFTVGYLVLAAISTVLYLLISDLSFGEAAYESVAGVATSALTVLDDPSRLHDGALIWRSGTQWLGGLGALALAIGIWPFLGGSRELLGPRGRSIDTLRLAPRPLPALKRVTAMYGVVTAGVVLAFIAVGLSLRDAVVHGFSSVSTGGFSSYADSIAHYDSVAVEIVALVAMAGAGFSLALVWLLLRGQFTDTLRAFELRIFAVALAAATVWVTLLRADDGNGIGERLFDSAFTVVSLATTTGHRTADWAGWQPGAVMLLLILLTIGGMAGSVSGGLRWIRVVGLLQFIWRELQRQLHPRSVRAVKVGRSSISEASVDRWHAQLVFMLSVTAVGAVVLGFGGAGIVESLSLGLSAVSTTGPAIGETGTIVTAADLSNIDRLALMPLMVAGRVSLYPAFVLLAIVCFGTQRMVGRRRQERAARSA